MAAQGLARGALLSARSDAQPQRRSQRAAASSPVPAAARPGARVQCRRGVVAALATPARADAAAYDNFEKMLSNYDFKFRVGDKACSHLRARAVQR